MKRDLRVRFANVVRWLLMFAGLSISNNVFTTVLQTTTEPPHDSKVQYKVIRGDIMKHICAQLLTGLLHLTRLWTRCHSLLPHEQLIGCGAHLFMEGRTRARDRPAVRWWRATGEKQRDSWARGTGHSHFDANLPRLRGWLTSGQALVNLYHLVNRDTSCETGDRLGTTACFTRGTSLDYKLLKEFFHSFVATMSP